MLKIGITGGIGSGKTTVCKLFELEKVPVFYADYEAKRAMNMDLTLKSEIQKEFGKDIYSEEGALNRSKLAAIVFNNENELKKLNSLVHPAVFRLFDEWAAQQNAPYVVKEAALLFESNSYKDCNFVILVKSPESLKIQRVTRRDSITKDDVLRRMDKQLTDFEKERRSDFVILNDEQQLLIPQFLDLHQRFLKASEVGK